jgi:hypothetical protein
MTKPARPDDLPQRVYEWLCAHSGESFSSLALSQRLKVYDPSACYRAAMSHPQIERRQGAFATQFLVRSVAGGATGG